ncbi:MAG: agmatine deiminase family protein [Pseudomonadota bacterium]
MNSSSNLSVLAPSELGYVMPAEWARHTATWMAWPTIHVQWENQSAVEQAYADVANAIARFEPVVMLVDTGQIEVAEKLCSDNVTVLANPADDSWMRDTGPSFIKHPETGKIAGVDWRFNCWGGYTPEYQLDAQMAIRILDHLDMEAYHSSLVLEGGAIHVDGEGTLVTTESVVLNANRNWGMDHAQAEAELCRATGAQKVIWLPGDPDGETTDMTDGHVDGIMCFVEPGVVLFERDVSSEGIYARLEQENRRALELATDAKGRKFEIIDIEVDHSAICNEDELFCSSYINFYLPNGGLVMPNYGVAADQQVKELLAGVFPDREIAGVDINAIAPGGGGIHCITQQQPA